MVYSCQVNIMWISEQNQPIHTFDLACLMTCKTFLESLLYKTFSDDVMSAGVATNAANFDLEDLHQQVISTLNCGAIQLLEI